MNPCNNLLGNNSFKTEYQVLGPVTKVNSVSLCMVCFCIHLYKRDRLF